MESFSVTFIEATPEGTTRDQGRSVRNWLKGLADVHESLIVDLSGLQILTPSFADECFGKLLLELGEEHFRFKIRLTGGSEPVRGLINQVLRLRLAELRNRIP